MKAIIYMKELQGNKQSGWTSFRGIRRVLYLIITKTLVRIGAVNASRVCTIGEYHTNSLTLQQSTFVCKAWNKRLIYMNKVFLRLFENYGTEFTSTNIC